MRKLTIMEWTLLHIVSEFANRPKFANYRLNYFFEDVLGINKSERLIRPCLDSLIQGKIIIVDNLTQFTEVTELFIQDIHLTNLGAEAVKRGYIPGAEKESSEVLYYDLLREQVFDVLIDLGQQEESVKITDETEFPLEFPEEAILAGLQKGILLPDKYRNNSIEAEEVSCNSELTEWRTDLLTVDLSDAQQLTCNYPITHPVKKLLYSILGEQFYSAAAWPVLAQANALPETFSIGEDALNEIELWVRLGDYFFFDCKIFEKLTPRISSALSGKTAVLFGCSEFSVKAGKWTEIQVPFSGPVKNSLVMDDSGDYLCSSLLPAVLENENLNIWIVYQAGQAIDLNSWFTAQLDQAVTIDPNIAVLYKLPFSCSCEGQCETAVCQRLAQLRSSIRQAAFLKNVNENCAAINVSFLDAEKVIPALSTYISGSTADEIRDSIVLLYSEFFRVYDTEVYEDFVIATIIDHFPDSINDLLFLLSAVLYCGSVDETRFVGKADQAFRDLLTPYMLDLLFMHVLSPDSVYPLPKLLSCAIEYNNIHQSVQEIEKLLPDMHFTIGSNPDALVSNLIECEDLFSVNRLAAVLASAIERAQVWGVTVFSERGPLYVVSENVLMLTRLLNMFILNEEGIANLYLIDTCVFLHTPDILKYFKDHEILRIPFTVLRELDYHKDNNTDLTLRKNAAFVCKQIEQRLDTAASDEFPNFAVEPRDYPELLPAGFSAHKHDDLILSAAFRYKLLNPIILTDDTNFRNIARSQGIRIKAWKNFIAERGGTATRSSDKSADTGAETAVQEGLKNDISSAEPTGLAKEQFLAQSIDFLKQPPFNLSAKKVKIFSAAGFQTLLDLYSAMASDINQKVKASSSRATVRQMADKLRAKVASDFPGS